MSRPNLRLLAGICLVMYFISISACARTLHTGSRVTGIAAYYADMFHGRKTASGETYDKNKLTAAHKTLPFGTKVKVTNLANMKTVIVKINDRGPFGDRKRIIDLSRAAANRLDMIRMGIIEVELEIIQMPDKK